MTCQDLTLIAILLLSLGIIHLKILLSGSILGTVSAYIHDAVAVPNTRTTMHLNLRFSLHFNLHTSGTQVQGINLLKRARKDGIDEDPLLALVLEESPNEVDCLPCMSELHPRISWKELDCSSPYTSEYPSGQISFKLYDLDLGYFARNLRQQATYDQDAHPDSLHAVPQSMWDKLYADWAGAITKLVEGSQIVAGFWDQGYLKVKPGQKTVQLRMVKIEDVQLMDDSVSSEYSGFCIDNYSKVIIKDSC
ncbi:unnamed protein product [Sphagnum tenellum]